MSGFTLLLTALGWSLLNSIWQMAVVWTAYYILTAGNKRISAAGKHNLALVFAAAGSGWMVCSFFQLLDHPEEPLISGFLPLSYQVNQWIPVISSIYLFVITVRLLKYGIQFVQGGGNKSEKSVSPVLQSFVDRQVKLLGITKRVRVYLSVLAETAETSGYLKPLVLLPATLLTRLSPEQLEAILIHELFHIRRNDYLINIYISCFQGILFFNPFARMLCNEISRERENACDDEVIERGFAPAIYAEALFCLEKFRQVPPGFSIAADGNEPWLLMERIRRVVGKPALRKNRLNPFIFFSLAASVGLFGLQQKTLVQQVKPAVASAQIPVIPLRYEMTDIRVQTPERRSKRKSRVHPGLVIKKMKAPLPPSMPSEPEPEAFVPTDKTFFAENNMDRDFSNQLAAGPTVESIRTGPGTPYVPSETLSYEDLPEVLQADSLQDLAIQNRITGVIQQSHLVATTALNELQKEIVKNRKQLKKLQIKNQQLILKHQKNIRPLLENMEQQLKAKKKEIDQLKIRILITDTEIIHI
jgi:Zn-dependent protease with chaperone function